MTGVTVGGETTGVTTVGVTTGTIVGVIVGVMVGVTVAEEQPMPHGPRMQRGSQQSISRLQILSGALHVTSLPKSIGR